jgi:hypothetical protein
MNLHEDMEREQMKMAILKQEQIFRQQVTTRMSIELVLVSIMHHRMLFCLRFNTTKVTETSHLTTLFTSSDPGS